MNNLVINRSLFYIQFIHFEMKYYVGGMFQPPWKFQNGNAWHKLNN